MKKVRVYAISRSWAFEVKQRVNKPNKSGTFNMAHRPLSSSAAAFLLSVPFATSAQLFVPTAQSASVSSSYSTGFSVSDSVSGSLEPVNLRVLSGRGNEGNAGASSTINSSQIGISAGVGVNLPNPSFTSGGTGGYGYPYAPSQESGSGAARIDLNFTVAQDVDVKVAVNDAYANVPSNYSFTSSLGLYKQNGDTFAAVADRSQLSQITRLAAGSYRLSANFVYDLHTYNGLAGGGASVLISAVPEPGTFGLMGLGLIGMAWVARRGARQLPQAR
jgi:PEP-CTERM motif